MPTNFANLALANEALLKETIYKKLHHWSKQDREVQICKSGPNKGKSETMNRRIFEFTLPATMIEQKFTKKNYT